MSFLGRFATVLLGAAAVGLMGVLLGAWWAPFVGGIAAGIFIPRARWAVLAGALAGLIAWGAPLEYTSIQYGLATTSLDLAAIMGFTGAATIPLALTLLTGTLLGFTGSWFGAVARGLYPEASRITRPALSRRAVQPAKTPPAKVRTRP